MKLTSPFLSSGASMRTAISTPTALGSAILVQRTILSWPLPGSAQRCLLTRSGDAVSAIVCENVLLGPAGEIEQRPGGQEFEARLREFGAVFAYQPLVELFLELVEVAHVARGIFALRVAKLRRAPVAGLLLLRQVDVEEFLDQFLEPVTVGVSADQARRGARAIERGGHDPQIGTHDADIEPREMIELESRRIAQQRLEVRRRIGASAGEPDEMLVALAVGQLNEAQAVAARDEAHGFGIDGDRPIRESHVCRQVFLMQMDRHFHS